MVELRHLAVLLLLWPLAACAGGSAGNGLGWIAARGDEGAGLPSPRNEDPALLVGLGPRRFTASLLEAQGERRIWRSPAGLVVATDGARVVATSGLTQVLAGTRFDGPDPLASPDLLRGQPQTTSRVVDLMRADRRPQGMRFGLLLRCRITPRATEDPSVLIAEEHCANRSLGRIQNLFWLDASSGEVLRSEQWVGPGMAMMAVQYDPGSTAMAARNVASPN